MPQQWEPSIGLTKWPLAIQLGVPHRSWESAPVATTRAATPSRESIRMASFSKQMAAFGGLVRMRHCLETVVDGRTIADAFLPVAIILARQRTARSRVPCGLNQD